MHKIAISKGRIGFWEVKERKMAKDGTNRGGARPGAGRKRKALEDKLMDGNPGNHELRVIEFKNMDDLQGEDMPKPSRLLSAKQKDGKKLQAAMLYKKTWEWLQKRGCAVLIPPELLERYAMSAARWIQCEQAVTEYGFLAKHPTTGQAIQSPYVAMSQNYMTQTSRLWNEIFQIVKENCSSGYKGENPQDDMMEMLLRKKSNG